MHFPRPTSCLVSVREFFGSVKIFHAATCLVRNCRMKIETITCQLKDKKTSLPVPLPNEMGRPFHLELTFFLEKDVFR